MAAVPLAFELDRFVARIRAFDGARFEVAISRASAFGCAGSIRSPSGVGIASFTGRERRIVFRAE